MTKKKLNPAAIFLIIIAVGVVGVLAFFLWLNTNQDQAIRLAFTPTHDIKTETMVAAPDYSDYQSFLGHDKMMDRRLRAADVFFIHPTTFFDRNKWNDTLDNEESLRRLDQFIWKHQVSAFLNIARPVAPRYRQATFGAFFDQTGQGVVALSRAYEDVLRAFDHFLETRNPDRPFFIASHSQGTYHALSLFKDRIADQSIAEKMIAAYTIGWPISVEADLAPFGLDVCAKPDDTQCVISWQTFGAGGDPSQLQAYVDLTAGLTGVARKDTEIVCVDPVSWTQNGRSDAADHKGAVALKMDDNALAEPQSGLTGTYCGEDGFLYLSNPPRDAIWTAFNMAGDNYHAYDINLFFVDLRDNAALRLQAWQQEGQQVAQQANKP